ncbi:MAG: 1-acyl-sn-glycerol-3-phosphate acyltransferase [Bacteroidales bacterium]|nr:1-acyl-sn-glycerol-3-phosphate acyltransferase [Bacteroidales bacterium]
MEINKDKLSWKARLCKFLLTKCLKFEAVSGPAPVDKCILAGAPHTSMWDFVVAYLFYRSFDYHPKCMIKASLFKGPLGWILRRCGGIPVDQKSKSAMVRSVIHEMESEKIFHLAIAVEGTRKPVKKWAKGYHLIAKEVGCPVYLCIFGWNPRQVGVIKEFTLTDDANADTARMQQEYEDMHIVGKHPEKFITK